MKQHEKSNRGIMGITVLAVAAIFFALHLALPSVTLWPFALVSLVIATMLASHHHSGRHGSRRLAQQTDSIQ